MPWGSNSRLFSCNVCHHLGPLLPLQLFASGSLEGDCPPVSYPWQQVWRLGVWESTRKDLWDSLCGSESGWRNRRLVMASWERRDPFSFLDCEAGSTSDLAPQIELTGMALEARHPPHLGSTSLGPISCQRCFSNRG